jgi:hypothetical protein
MITLMANLQQQKKVRIWTIKVDFFWEENDGICKVKIGNNLHIKK